MSHAYLAIVCVAISQFGKIEINLYIYLIGVVLFLSGCAIIVMISNHLKRVDQLITSVHDIETSLRLEQSMARQKVFPYYFLMAISCISVIIAAWFK